MDTVTHEYAVAVRTQTRCISGQIESYVTAGSDVRSLRDDVCRVTLQSQVGRFTDRYAATTTALAVSPVDASRRSTMICPLEPRVLCRWIAVRPTVQPHHAAVVNSQCRWDWSHRICSVTIQRQTGALEFERSILCGLCRMLFGKWAAIKGVFIATQLNSTSSWVASL